NLVFILALNTMFSGLLSWLFLKERPRAATMIAMAFMIVGVSIIVRDSAATGHLFGDLLALASAFLLACAITLSRASGRDMGFAALIGVFLPFLVSAFMVTSVGFQVEA